MDKNSTLVPLLDEFQEEEIFDGITTNNQNGGGHQILPSPWMLGDPTMLGLTNGLMGPGPFPLPIGGMGMPGMGMHGMGMGMGMGMPGMGMGMHGMGGMPGNAAVTLGYGSGALGPMTPRVGMFLNDRTPTFTQEAAKILFKSLVNELSENNQNIANLYPFVPLMPPKRYNYDVVPAKNGQPLKVIWNRGKLTHTLYDRATTVENLDTTVGATSTVPALLETTYNNTGFTVDNVTNAAGGDAWLTWSANGVTAISDSISTNYLILKSFKDDTGAGNSARTPNTIGTNWNNKDANKDTNKNSLV